MSDEQKVCQEDEVTNDNPVDVSVIEGSCLDTQNDDEDKPLLGKKPGLMLVGCIVITLIIISGIIISLFISRSSQRPYGTIIKDSADAIVAGDWNKYSKYLSDEQMNKINESIKSGTIENGEAFMQSMRAIFVTHFGEGFKITVKEKKSEKLKADELKSSEKIYNEFYDVNVTFKKAYRVSVDMTIDGNLKTETSDVYYIIAKLNGKWVVLNSDFS